MSRTALALAAFLSASAVAFGQAQSAPPPKSAPANSGQQPELNKQREPEKTSDKEAAPPEEDTTVAVTDYSFNPLAAKKSIEVGNFYLKTRKDYRAAANRYREATKWNDGDTEAWLKLGEVEEKLKDSEAVKAAYTKYLELAPEAKNAGEIRKKLASIK
jgi:tetratricopeptide (TPR) repeat protein